MTNTHDNETSFNITEAAKQVGVVPATLRNWEKNNLFVARRTSNGYRTFSVKEIELLGQIKSLIEQGMTINTVRYVIDPVSMHFADSKATGISRQSFGDRWRKNRLNRGYSVRYVALQIGISASYLNKIEHAKTGNISFDILHKLASFYGEEVFPDEETITEKEEIPHIEKREGIFVESSVLQGVSFRSMTRCAGHNHMTIMEYRVQPGCGRAKPAFHDGEEFIYLISGSLRSVIDGNIYLVQAGDALHFKGKYAHEWVNNGKDEVCLLWVFSAANSQDMNE